MNHRTMIMNYIKEEVLRGRPGQLGEDDDLLSSGVLSSLSILQLVAYIEESMGLEIPDEDVVYENFNSVAALGNYLDTRH